MRFARSTFLLAQGALQLEHVVILADADVLLHMVDRDLGARGQQDLELGQLVGHLLQVVAQTLRQQLRHLVPHLQALGRGVA